MAPRASDCEQVLDLIDALLSDEISAADVELLKQYLRHDDAARLLYVEYLDLDSELCRIVGRAEPSGDLMTIANAPDPTARWALASGLMAAAVVLLAVSLFWWNGVSDRRMARQQTQSAGSGPAARAPSAAEQPPPVVARIVAEVDAHWTDADVIGEVGAELHPGEFVDLAEGTAEVKFTSGVRCFISETTGLLVNSAHACTLQHGTAYFQVPAAARGFRVLTPGGQIVDLGTEFGVYAGPYGLSEVHVLKGTVQASAQHGAGGVLTLGRGRAALLDPVRKGVTLTGFDVGKFIRPVAVAAGVLHSTETVEFLPLPPRSLRPGALGTHSKASLFVERTGVVLAEDLTIQIVHPDGLLQIGLREGQGERALRPEQSILSAGTRLDSFLLQFGGAQDRDGLSKITGRMVFDRPILAVIGESDQLMASARVFGHSETVYPYDTPGVGLEYNDRQQDRLVLSDDRRTLVFTMTVSNPAQNLDQVRILLRSALPEPEIRSQSL